MKFWPTTYSVSSEKNGTITVRNFFGRTSVLVGGYEESGKYLAPIVRSACRRLPKVISVRSVLLLGLAGGAMMQEIEKRFPDAVITVVEWDPAMVDIAKGIRPWKREPSILIGDFFEVLPRLAAANRQFDFIIVDVFFGGVPDARLGDPARLASLEQVLAPGGFVFVNLFKSVSFVPAFEAHLHLVDVWKVDYNSLALFTKK